MKDLKQLLANYGNWDNEQKFVSVSDDIWQIGALENIKGALENIKGALENIKGALENIKKEVSDEAFVFHIAVNMIGNWKSDGWHYIFAEGNALVPYIGETLSKLGLDELKNAFENVLSVFPDFAKDCDEDTYYDVINFLSNPRFKVSDERLNAIDMEKRKQMSNHFNNAIADLDDISETLWGYNSEDEGWKIINDYISKIE